MNPGKSIAITQPNLFPPLGYFQLIHAVDCFYLLEDVVTRTRILEQSEVTFLECTQGLQTFRNRIHTAYHRAPYYPDIADELDNLCHDELSNLLDFSERSVLWVCRYLKIDTPILRWSDVQQSHLPNQDRIIKFCHQVNAKQFLSLPNAPIVYEESCFQKNKIQLFFLLSQLKAYPQFSGEFQVNLSILDLLMHVSREKLQHHLLGYRIALPILQTALIK